MVNIICSSCNIKNFMIYDYGGSIMIVMVCILNNNTMKQQASCTSLDATRFF